MRMEVNYTWGPGSYGRRVFDIPEDATATALMKAARAAAPHGILQIQSIKKNSGQAIFDDRLAAMGITA